MNRSFTKKVVLSALLAAGVCPVGAVSAATIPGLYDTGVLDNGTLAPLGSVDVHYALVSSADPTFPGPSAHVTSPNPLWVPNTPTSQWVTPATTQQNEPGGTYTYQLQFSLCKLNPDTASISGEWAADDTGSIYLNGSDTGAPPQGFGYWAPFSITHGFVAGLNTLDFVVFNQTEFPSPTGLQVNGLSGTAAPVPLPPALALFGSGLVGLIGLSRRRQAI